jgi:hypothetical protein
MTCVQCDVIKMDPAPTHVLGQFLVRGGVLRKEVVLVRSIALRMRPAAQESTSGSARMLAHAFQTHECTGKACWQLLCNHSDRTYMLGRQQHAWHL